MIVKLTFKRQKLFQSPSVNNQAFQKFINLCRNEYGEAFLVRDRNNDTSVFTFRVNESVDALREKLEKSILPQALPGSWKPGSYVMTIEEEVAAVPRTSAEVPVYKPPVSAAPRMETPAKAPEPVTKPEPKKPEPAKPEEKKTSGSSAEVDAVRDFLKKQSQTGAAKPSEPTKPEPAKPAEPAPKKTDSSWTDDRTPRPDMDALRDFLSKQGQGGSKPSEPTKPAEPVKPSEPAPKKTDSSWTDDRTPRPDMDALRDFLSKQGQGGSKPSEPAKPAEPVKPSEPAPRKTDSSWTDDRTPKPDMDALRDFLAKQGKGGGSTPIDEAPKTDEPKKDEESAPQGAWSDDRTPRPDMDALRAFLSKQSQGGSDEPVEISSAPDADSPVHEGEVEILPGHEPSTEWSGGEVVDVEAQDVTEDEPAEEDTEDSAEETPEEPAVDVSSLLGALTAHISAQEDGKEDPAEEAPAEQSTPAPKKSRSLMAFLPEDDGDTPPPLTGIPTGEPEDAPDLPENEEEPDTPEAEEDIPQSADTPQEEAVPQDEKPTPVTPESTGTVPTAPPAPKVPENEILAQVYDLLGAHAFKELCDSVHSRANFIRVNNTKKFFLSDAYLFAVNRGEGFSRALELFSALMVEEGIIEQKDINELTPPAPTDRELEDRMQRFLRNVESVMESSRTLSLDISEWIGRTGSAIFKKLLLHVFQRVGNTLVIFRMPSVSKTLIDQTKRDLDDIMITKAVIFEPFTQEELRSFAARILQDYHFTADESVWPYYDRKVMDEKRDGYFYGLHTIRKITGSMIRRAEEYCISTGQNTTVIIPEMVSDWIPQLEDGMDSMTELESLVGMASVKEQILEIVNQIKLSRTSGSKQPCMHMAFVGSAGTGKTTVARILGKLLKEMGILRIGNFYEHSGRDLCGRFVGETAIKTTAICQEAYGSVLFIDEAYSLFRGDFSTNDYGREAIDTLIAEMENHRDDMLVIFAGYTQDMDILMTANAGMESRVPYRITFPNYEPETLSQIFLHMVDESFTHDTSLEEASAQYFLNLPPEQIQAADFGNARFVRNLYERVWGKAAMRCTDTPLDELCITAQDFHAAVDSMESTTKKKKTKKPIGFG